MDEVVNRLAYIIDDDGYVIDTMAVSSVEEYTEGNIIAVMPSKSFWKKRWNGEEWVEGATQEEIDELTKPSPPTEMDLLKEQIQAQQIIIDELLFEVIPSLLPKEEGMI